MFKFRAVKTRLILLTTLCLGRFAIAAPPPDAHEILRVVRQAQSSQHQTLLGQLRNGPKVVPFRLIIDGGVIRYQFAAPAETLQLRLLEKDSRLDEITKGGTEKITAAHFDDKVRDTDISYEDLALKFLYWSNAAVEGEQTLLLQKCWIVRTEPSGKNDSQYSRVMLWIEQKGGALLQAEAYDRTGALSKRFKVVSGQKIDGFWTLKQMRIETLGTGASKDRTPTYLEISGSEKAAR
ncbi:MAG: outer rane lipoproteinsorting protein [Chthoniobacteraceae bacterium]|nr:outer rane lipoproteinsorting protein [Chthoniobacteraceae bacterium]MDB6174511.1 outer rane lipoproteinsorting protein [Chthoniobacteraceae bacterium]